MGLIIPHSFLTPRQFAKAKAEEDRVFAQEDYVARKTREAEQGLQMPPILPADATLEQIATSMSWDFQSAGWEKRRIQYAKNLKAARKRFMPDARRMRRDGSIENIYAYGDIDLQWFYRGDCCVECQNWKSEDPAEHLREHEELQARLSQNHAHGTPPTGVPLEHLCSTCGNNLEHQKRVDAEAA